MAANARPEDSVWQEPQAASRPDAPPATPYARWLADGQARTPAWRSWLIAAALALVAGPFAIIGAFLVGGDWVPFLLAVLVVGPLVEEIVKVGAPLMVVERWPYLFRARFQILLCAAASGLVFAAIENLLYLHVYIPDPTDALVRWRWTVGVALHLGCSLIAGLGVARVWSDALTRRAPPRPELAFPLIIAAVVIHGAYNAFAIVLEALHPF